MTRKTSLKKRIHTVSNNDDDDDDNDDDGDDNNDNDNDDDDNDGGGGGDTENVSQKWIHTVSKFALNVQMLVNFSGVKF